MMRRHLPTVALVVVASVLVTPLAQLADAQVAGADTYTFTTGTPVLDTITNGTSAAPWNESQGDPSYPAYPSNLLFPTYTPGGASTPAGTGNTTPEPNLAVYPAANSTTDGNSPYPSGTVGTPGPLDGYCGTGAQSTEAGASPVRQPAGSTLPLAPAYFPHIVRNSDGSLTGYFDYRPKDADEAIVVGHSTDGVNWTYEGEALEQNPGLCPSADVNDDGEGHPNVIDIGGTTRLYTLQRPAGDNPGIGMLVHTLTAPTSADPLNGVPGTEQVGIDPDAFATSGAAVPTTGGAPATIAVSGTGTAGSPEQLLAGGFVDLTQDPTPNASTVINCTGVGGVTLTGCTSTAPGGITVNTGDLIEQVIGYVGTGLTVSAGPNTTTGDGGTASIAVVSAPGGTAGFTDATTGTLYNTNAPNRAYVNGVAVYCSQANANPTTKMESCTTGGNNGPLTVAAGAPITSDPIVPSSAGVTTGLVAPDGIVGVLPSYPGTPSGATDVLYTEKELNYFVAGTTTNSAATKFSTGTITFTPSPYTGQDLPAVISPSSPVTVSMGDITTSTIVPVTCTGLTTGTTDSLTGCTSTAGSNDQYNATSLIGAPGAATVSAATLNETGEGAGAAPVSAKNVAKLFKNNEDLTVLRVAYTTDGTDFSSAGLANGGVISGAGTEGADYDDINNPSSTTSPANLNAFATPGSADATEMRFVGSGGSIITNDDGTYGLFLSGAWAADGDSDAFNQIFYSSSTDGEHWSVPVSVVSTDYTFSASAAQDAALAGGHDQALGISAYYSGRAYGPSVVQNSDGTLTMVFAGYRLPKPITAAGTVLGTDPSSQYTVGATDPALYRNILTVTLDATPNDGATPEAPLALLLPLAGLAVGTVAVLVSRRRRRIAPH